MNDDLIRRKMAIDAIIDHIREKFAQRDTPLNYISGLYKAEDIIEILPSAQPNLQPTCNQLATDTISRQAAIELILSGKVGDDSTEWVGIECPEECNSFLDWAAEAVGKMPSAERKKGRWIRLDEYPNDVSVKCSECGVTLEDWMMGAFYNYCPNCGADMRGEEG